MTAVMINLMVVNEYTPIEFPTKQNIYILHSALFSITYLWSYTSLKLFCTPESFYSDSILWGRKVD